MEIFLLFVIFLILLDIESKISKIDRKKELPKKITSNVLKEFVNKEVSINLENDNVSDSYLFNAISNTKGKIVEYDDEWMIFEYKEKGKIIRRYFRIEDISSIDA